MFCVYSIYCLHLCGAKVIVQTLIDEFTGGLPEAASFVQRLQVTADREPGSRGALVFVDERGLTLESQDIA